MRKPKEAHDILAEEFNNLLHCDVGEGNASTHLVK